MNDFVYVTYIYTTPQKVWDAITKPEFAKQYWLQYNVSDWKKGSRWQHLHGDGSGKVMIDGTVLGIRSAAAAGDELDAARSLARAVTRDLRYRAV